MSQILSRVFSLKNELKKITICNSIFRSLCRGGAFLSLPNSALATNSSLQFDGSQNYGQADNTSAFFPANFTIELWMKGSSVGQNFITAGLASPWSGAVNGWALGDWKGDGKVHFYDVHSPTYAFDDTHSHLTSTTGVFNGNWHHIAVTYNGSVQTLWIDGVSESTITNSFVQSTESGPLYLGTLTPTIGTLNGIIDSVRISNSVRYTTTFTPPTSFVSDGNTVLIYNLDEGSGTTAADGSGNSRTLTLHGSPLPSWVTGTPDTNPQVSIPTITTSAPSSVATSTMTANGNITATGGATATVRGFAYGTNSTLSGGGDTATTTDTAGQPFSTGAFTGSLSSLTPNTTYYFRSYATNSAGTGYGTIVSTTTLAVAKPTVTTQSAGSVTATTATLNGNITVTGNINPTVRGFAWGTGSTLSGGGDTATTTESGDFSTGAFTNTSLTLTCNTTYYSRAYATNSQGTGYGAISSSFTTTACKPTVTTSAVSTFATSTATYTGNITVTGGADATQSGFAYSTNSSLSSGVSTSTLGSQSGTATFNSSVTGLTSNTTYYTRAYATNSAGTGYGSIVSFTTTAITAPTLTTQAASSLTATGATLNGTITSVGNEGTTQSGFAYGTSATLTSVIATSTLGGQTGTASFSSAFSSLTCNTTYYFRPYATNSGGTGYGTIVSLLTTACIPTLTTDTPTSVSTSTLTLNGTISATGGANATQSGFAYSTNSTLSSGVSTTTEGAKTGAVSFTSSLTSLTPNTVYYFRSYATNSAGTGYGTIQSTTTLAVNTPTVTTQAATSIFGASAMGNGNITNTGSLTVTTRGFAYGTTASYGATTTQPGNSGIGDFPTGAFTDSISALTCNTTYHVAAYATNSSGTGYGSDVTFTTDSCSSNSASSGSGGLFFTSALPTTIQTGSNDLQKTIDSLLSQIKSLQTQIAARNTGPIFTRELEFGMHGDDITALQLFLAKDKTLYPEGLITGYFGSLTRSAVRRFQARYGIKQVGRVGPITLEKLNELIGK